MMRALAWSLSLVVILGGCAKPACNKDAHCRETEPPRVDSCPDGLACEPGLACLAGSCELCSDPSQCASGVCMESGRCEELPCRTDDECPSDEICDGGQCLYHASDSERGTEVCQISAIYFALDSARLSPNNQARLQRAAPCLIERLAEGGTLVLESHADAVGDETYNIALTQRRGASLLSFLSRLGLPEAQIRVLSKGAREASGDEELSRTRERRVVLRLE